MRRVRKRKEDKNDDEKKKKKKKKTPKRQVRVLTYACEESESTLMSGPRVTLYGRESFIYIYH